VSSAASSERDPLEVRASADCGEDADCSRPSSACSSRSSSSAPSRPPGEEGGRDHRSKRTEDRRISLPEDMQPKPTSDKFKALRKQHYDEIAALKAFKPLPEGAESSNDTDTSDENDPNQTKTNTNTNINQTISKAVDTRPRVASADLDNSGASSDRDSAQKDVRFTGGSDAESCEEFRESRRKHYSHQWRQDPVESASATASCLETNTNTNLNAGSCRAAKEDIAKNPMEGGRPPVKFDEGRVDTAFGGVQRKALDPLRRGAVAAQVQVRV